MLHNKSYVFLYWILLSTLALSCSTTSNTGTTSGSTGSSGEGVSKYPDWYENSRSIQSDEVAYFAYATALAPDSAASAEKAVRQAKAALKSAISGRLESIRNDAVDELGSDSGLDSPRFIIALRKAENNVPSAAGAEGVEVAQNSATGSGYRAFAKVTVDKSALIEVLDKDFSAYANAWNAMKESKAFSRF